jgi:hypothetical protein
LPSKAAIAGSTLWAVTLRTSTQSAAMRAVIEIFRF